MKSKEGLCPCLVMENDFNAEKLHTVLGPELQWGLAANWYCYQIKDVMLNGMDFPMDATCTLYFMTYVRLECETGKKTAQSMNPHRDLNMQPQKCQIPDPRSHMQKERFPKT
jgi:hypothetical protein